MDLNACKARAEAALAQLLGSPPRSDQAGNWPFDHGSARLVVAVVQPTPQHPPLVAVLSQLAQVPKTPDLLDLLNEINAQVSFVRLYWTGGSVVASAELVAETVDPPELGNAIGQVATIVDAYDDVIQARFAGAPAPTAVPPPGRVSPLPATASPPPPPPPPPGDLSPYFPR